ncbi:MULTISPECIES: GDCCVxC domain-containing (seleno)protein [unclassified Bradyrhizobium]|nr:MULTISPECIES: GDCCVxC domain-containing (seleno)protein [unclassified Bradyrhizobium]
MKGCGERLKPKTGNCCVFCSYGNLPSAYASAATGRRRPGVLRRAGRI